jgi:hypothetical protein
VLLRQVFHPGAGMILLWSDRTDSFPLCIFYSLLYYVQTRADTSRERGNQEGLVSQFPESFNEFSSEAPGV